MTRRKGRHGLKRGPRIDARAGATHASPLRARAPRAAILIRAGVIVAAGLLVYWNSLSAPFLFDDQNSIIGNRQIRELWPLSIPLSPPSDTPVAGRPIVNLSFALNYAIGGLDVLGYHLFNLAVHLLAALTLFGVVRRTWFGGATTNVAWACALIWMLHPLQTEAVNYLSERTESMMGLFYLLTLYCSIRGINRGKREGGRDKWERGRGRWEVGAVMSCAVGMACKESMVTAPVMVVLYDRILGFDSFKESFRARHRLYAGLAATWLVLAALMSLTPRTSVGFETGTGSWVYLLNQFELIVRYLWLTVWPRALVLDYGLPQPLALRDVLPEAALVSVLGIAVVAALALRPPLGLLGTWFFVTLAPTTSIVPIATEVGAERRMYLPLAGIVVFAVLVWRRLTRHARVAGIVAAACVCGLLAAGTILRNREYESRLSIARTIVERWPTGRAHYLLGTELVEAGRRAEAMAELRASARDYPGAHFALGTELLADGMLEAALGELQAFVRALPTHANVVPARDMMGRALLALGRFDQAVEQFTLVLTTQPGYPLRGQVMAFLEQARAARLQGGR